MQQDAGEQVEGAGVDGQIRHCVVFESISNLLKRPAKRAPARGRRGRISGRAERGTDDRD